MVVTEGELVPVTAAVVLPERDAVDDSVEEYVLEGDRVGVAVDVLVDVGVVDTGAEADGLGLPSNNDSKEVESVPYHKVPSAAIAADAEMDTDAR